MHAKIATYECLYSFKSCVITHYVLYVIFKLHFKYYVTEDIKAGLGSVLK